MTRIDYGLLMRRVMTRLMLSAHGATVNLDPVRVGTEHPSRLLQEPSIIRATVCHACQKETDGKPACPSCGERTEVVYVSLYWLQRRWLHAHSERRKRELLGLALEVLRLAQVRRRGAYDTGTLDGRLAYGWLMASDQMTAREVARQVDKTEGNVRRWRGDARSDMARARAAWERCEALFEGTNTRA